MLRFFLSASPFSTFSSAWFPVLLFRFLVLGFLFVSFHPSRLRSHSCSTGASLPLSLPGFSPFFPLSFVRGFPGSDYSASAFSFPFIPASPRQWFFPVPVYPPFGFGTQLSVLPFTDSRLASQRLPRSSRLSFRFSLVPLVNTLGSGYSA